MPSRKRFSWWKDRQTSDPGSNGSDRKNNGNNDTQPSSAEKLTPSSRHASSCGSSLRGYPRANGAALAGSFWSDVVRDLHYIDESSRTSLNSDSVYEARSIRKLSTPDGRPLTHLLSLPPGGGTTPSLTPSQQTLSISGLGDTPVFDDEDPPLYGPPNYTASYPDFRPCMVELDGKGNAHTQPIKQLNFDEKGPITIKDDGGGMAPPFELERDFRYYFQHPYARLFVTYFVIFCNFLIFAEDPISHSHVESEIPVMGNVFSFVVTKYPPELKWKLIKVFFWILTIFLGLVIGKQVIHKFILGRLLRLKMFYDEQGSWMIMFLTTVLLLYILSHLYNACLTLFHPNYCTYRITALMGITNSSFMKAAACGTWLGDFVTAWMVTDMMLQDNLYPEWAPRIRAFWRTGNTRIMTFWLGSIGMTVLVVTLIVTDLVNWDLLNHDFVATTELSRAFLASFILVMDLLIVMQDWDFPHFTSTLDINLPGMKIKALRLNFCRCVSLKPYWRIHITGKWFNYGIILLVMILDLNMWKNQIFYIPVLYGQYIGPDYKVYTVSEQDVLLTGNTTLWSFDWRSSIFDPETNLSLREMDMKMNSRYLGYTLEEKCAAFIPSLIGFVVFVLLVSLHGRFPASEVTSKVTSQVTSLAKKLRMRKKQYRSSWKRDRGSLHQLPADEDDMARAKIAHVLRAKYSPKSRQVAVTQL